MNKHTYIVLSLMMSIFSLLMTACGSIIDAGGDKLYPDNNEVPIASNFKTALQYKLQAADHWNNIANDLATSITAAIKQKSPYVTLYVKKDCFMTKCMQNLCTSNFNQIFSNEMESALVNLGNRVSAVAAANVATVEIDVQTATFNKNRPQYRYAGIAKEVNHGVWAVHDVVTVTYSPPINVLSDNGNALMSDYLSIVQPSSNDALNWFRTQFASGSTPRTELIVTVSVKSADQVYLVHNTNIYYIADGDESQYSCTQIDNTPQAPKIPVIPVKGDCQINRQCN